MSTLQTAALVGSVLAGIVPAIVLLLAFVDWLTRGWIRNRVQGWLGIERLRRDHHVTQIFLADLAEANNDLSEVVCEQHDIPKSDRPKKAEIQDYERLMEEDEVGRGDFLRG